MNNIIFDFDGVLGDTIELFNRYHHHLKPHQSYEEAKQDQLQYFFTTQHSKKDNPTEKELNLKYEWLSGFIEFAHHNDMLPVPLFQEFIDVLIQKQIPNIAVVSSGTREYLIPALNSTDLNPSHILGFEDHHSKEEKIAIVCKDWDVNPKDTLYFTDTISDVLELRDIVGIIIGCTWGLHGYQFLSTVLPDELILQDFHEIHRLFR